MAWTDGIKKACGTKVSSHAESLKICQEVSPMVQRLLNEVGIAMFGMKTYRVKSSINGAGYIFWTLENDVKYSLWMLQEFHGPNYFGIRVHVHFDSESKQPYFSVGAGKISVSYIGLTSHTKSLSEDDLKSVLAACVEKALRVS